MTTDTERLQWLMSKVTYIEHDNKAGVSAAKSKRGGYWPQSEDDYAEAAIDDLCGLGFIDYIDAMIKEESK